MVDVETVMTGLMDEFKVLRPHRFKVLIFLSSIFFAVGLSHTTQGGMYVLQLMDWYAASFCVLIIAVAECVAINWIYGNAKFAANVKEMLGKLPGRWWRICWQWISPIIILGVLVFSLVKYEPAKYGEMLYPVWADAIGWCMTMASVLPIPAVAIYKYYKAEGTGFMQKWRNATKPQIQIEVKVADVEDGLDVNKLNGAETQEQQESLLRKEAEANSSTTHV
jgi:hypothetical protein